MRDKEDEFGLHESEWTRRVPDRRDRFNVTRLLQYREVAPIAGGVEGGSDEEGDQGGDGEHKKERQEPSLVKVQRRPTRTVGVRVLQLLRHF